MKFYCWAINPIKYDEQLKIEEGDTVQSSALFIIINSNSKTMKNEVNEIKISYCEKLTTLDSEPVNSSDRVAKLLFETWDKDTIGLHETFKVLLLNNANKVKGSFQASTGGLTGTLVDLRILFAVVLKTLSVGIILAHNHPSGIKKASGADIALTKKIKKAADLFDIRVLDHLIILPNGAYFSFSDNGML